MTSGVHGRSCLLSALPELSQAGADAWEVFPEPTLNEQHRRMTKWQILLLPNPGPPHLYQSCRVVVPASSMLLGAVCLLSEPQKNYRTVQTGSIFRSALVNAVAQRSKVIRLRTHREAGLGPHPALLPSVWVLSQSLERHPGFMSAPFPPCL